MHRRVGGLLIATGALHTMVGLIGFQGPLAQIVRARFVNTVDGQPEREAAVWFLISGSLLVLLGGLCRWTQRRLDGELPAPLGWGLLAISSAGAVLMPVSGFWLVIPQALLILRAARPGTGGGALPDDSLLNQVMSDYDVRDEHTRSIAAPPSDVYSALKGVTPRDIPIVGLLMGVRGLPARLTGRQAENLPGDRPLIESFLAGGFTLLAEEPDREFVAGTIAQFWKLHGGASHHVRDAAQFVAFAAPGYAKAAITFHIQPVRDGTLLTTETRVLTTEPASRHAFARYWRVIYPGSALIRWALLRAVERAARKAGHMRRVGASPARVPLRRSVPAAYRLLRPRRPSLRAQLRADQVRIEAVERQ